MKLTLMASRTYQSPSDEQIINSPNDVDLFGGISGISIERFEIIPGLEIQPVFAHVMAPYLLAFAKPEKGQRHTAPWKAASGGLGFDVNSQIALSAKCEPTGFDRINTVWWILSLLRLRHAVGIRLPIISDTDFSAAKDSSIEPAFWPIEMSPMMFSFDGHGEVDEVPIATLRWIQANFVSGATLMDDGRFNLAYRALDGSHSSSSLSSAMLLIWSALEALFRPGRKNLTHRLSLCIATYIETKPRDSAPSASHLRPDLGPGWAVMMQ